MQQDTSFQPEKRTAERCSLTTYFAGFPHLAARAELTRSTPSPGFGRSGLRSPVSSDPV
jgi:hypothetical protein